jgi:hypothetical protein
MMVNVLGAILLSTSKTLILSLLTERMILKVTLEVLEWLAKRSSNSVDDKIVALMRERLAETGVV